MSDRAASMSAVFVVLFGILIVAAAGFMDLAVKSDLFPLATGAVIAIWLLLFFAHMVGKAAFLAMGGIAAMVMLLIVSAWIGNYFSTEQAKAAAQEAEANALQAQIDLEKAQTNKENLQKWEETTQRWQDIVTAIKDTLKPPEPPNVNSTPALERKFRLGWDWGLLVFWGEYGLGIFIYAYVLLLTSAIKKRGATAFTMSADFGLFVAGLILLFIAIYPAESRNNQETVAASNTYFWLSVAVSSIYGFVLTKIKSVKEFGEEWLKDDLLPLVLFKTVMFPLVGSIIVVFGADYLLNLLGNELVWTTQLTAQTALMIRLQGSITGLLLPKVLDQIGEWRQQFRSRKA